MEALMTAAFEMMRFMFMTAAIVAGGLLTIGVAMKIDEKTGWITKRAEKFFASMDEDED